MATRPAAPPSADQTGHRRNKSSSASVLKSLMASKNHKRSPSDGTALSPSKTENIRPMSDYNPRNGLMLPPDHPHNQLRAPVKKENLPSNPPSPRKSQDTQDRTSRGLHKRTLSTVSLKSLGKDKEKEKDKRRDKSREPSRSRADKSEAGKPKKTKSGTNLTGVLQKLSSKEARDNNNVLPKDKENTTPPSSSRDTEVHTPIWAQFASQNFEEVRSTSKVPLNDRRSIEQEIALYTPTEYSPSKQRNFFDYGQPALQKRTPSKDKERPRSGIFSNHSTTSVLDTLTRKISNERTPLSATKGNEVRTKDDYSQNGNGVKGGSRRTSPEGRNSNEDQHKGLTIAKKGARVMAAVAAFNVKSKEARPETPVQAKLDPQNIEAEFEAVLESRNIPQHQRAQMRTLKLEIKADFVRTHKVDTPSGSVSKGTFVEQESSKRPTLHRSSKSRGGSEYGKDEASTKATSATSTKRERPRSRTFTFSKGDSPIKKQRPEGSMLDAPTGIPKSPSNRSLSSTSATQKSSFFSRTQKPAAPDEFVTYMRKNTKPQEVEVGKLQKLRQLLRNETVEWVNLFIRQGGMTELVGLLHRIMEIEWREEHEDTLLHEALRCLKALYTTDLASKELSQIASTLFPALLAMLFDDEHKGPSEFTTRELLVSILFAHLSAAPPAEQNTRARELLSYLKDPVKEKEAQTLSFITEMQQPRPYRVWCREIVNTTKEVFWIFVHHLTVIPMAAPEPEEANKPYSAIHFPGPRAIVGAAPHVGCVEWDATNYIATHLDLLNGLLACLPDTTTRNTLRAELRASGLEKILTSLKACNVKFHRALHDGLKTWVKAAVADEWDVKAVRCGPGDGRTPGSPVKSPNKSPKKVEKAPQLGVPKMDIGLGLGLDLGAPKNEGKKAVVDDWI